MLIDVQCFLRRYVAYHIRRGFWRFCALNISFVAKYHIPFLEGRSDRLPHPHGGGIQYIGLEVSVIPLEDARATPEEDEQYADFKNKTDDIAKELIVDAVIYAAAISTANIRDDVELLEAFSRCVLVLSNTLRGDRKIRLFPVKSIFLIIRPMGVWRK